MLSLIHAVAKSICPKPVWSFAHSIRCAYNLRCLDRDNRRWVKLRTGGGGIETIEIETINRCNGTCPFCPVNAAQPQRPYAKMSEELFHKIIDDLAGMNYSRTISLYSNNEAFLDERIINFHKYAREKLPNAYFLLYTNGSLLTMNKFLEIMRYLDKLIIDNYNDEGKINTPELQKIYDYLQEHPELSKRVKFWFRLQTNLTRRPSSQQAGRKESCRKCSVLTAIPSVNHQADWRSESLLQRCTWQVHIG